MTRYCVECGCTVRPPAMDRAPIVTERGLYCDAECLANAEIARLERMRRALSQPKTCPACREGHTSPAYSWTCSDACADMNAASIAATTAPAEVDP